MERPRLIFFPTRIEKYEGVNQHSTRKNRHRHGPALIKYIRPLENFQNSLSQSSWRSLILCWRPPPPRTPDSARLVSANTPNCVKQRDSWLPGLQVFHFNNCAITWTGLLWMFLASQLQVKLHCILSLYQKLIYMITWLPKYEGLWEEVLLKSINK